MQTNSSKLITFCRFLPIFETNFSVQIKISQATGRQNECFYMSKSKLTIQS